MLTLTEFLLARIAEDEDAARAASMEGHEWGGARWMNPDGYQNERVCIDNGSTWGGSTVVYDEGSPSDEQAAHIARHDPARVLAECEAKRRIVELHESWPVLAQSPPSFDRMDGDDLNSVTFRASQQMAWLTEQEYRARFGSEPPTAPVLRLLALPYADHPDYREDWRP